ncbi:BREX-3 system P-loop-containing protein BrxF [Chloroflexus sp.]|uniref:BREX-3 system P-loop-containing protein BrxF n=1 Tax=Chloroflexus sp. TaxID=1904827 RepID=UPI002ACD9B21|nr:BREX-3 system P-loop-containing protein BrxF [Chloroflexus sp.]
MVEPVADQVLRAIDQVRERYYRLIVIVGPAGSGKTSALQAVSALTSAPMINVNLELSRRLLNLTERQRAIHLPRILGDIVQETAAELVLLDNIELLFDVHLHVDPLRLLQRLARNRTVVATWNGTVGPNGLTYAVPGHPEYRRYPTGDLVIVEAKP